MTRPPPARKGWPRITQDHTAGAGPNSSTRQTGKRPQVQARAHPAHQTATGSPATQHTARTTHTRAARGGSQHGYLPNRHRKMVANQTTRKQTSNQKQHLQLPNMRRRTRLRTLTPTQQRRGRPHHPAHTRQRSLASKHTNQLPLVQPAQGQRNPAPQTEGAETARTKNRGAMVESRCRTETRVPASQRGGPPRISERSVVGVALPPQGEAGRPRRYLA